MEKPDTGEIVIERGFIVSAGDGSGLAAHISSWEDHPALGARSAIRLMSFLFWVCLFALPVQAAGSGNPTHDRLLTLPRGEQAKILAKNVGQGCVGVSAFPMGVTASGKARGLAYWSVRCKDGRGFALQIAPDAQTVVVDCRVLQANGKECFKKF